MDVCLYWIRGKLIYFNSCCYCCITLGFAVDDGSGVVSCFIRLPAEDVDTTEANTLIDLQMKRDFRDAASIASLVATTGEVDTFNATLQLDVTSVRMRGVMCLM